MSLSELTLNKLPQFSSKQLQRKLQRMQTHLNKAAHRRVVKTQRAALRWQGRQYYLTTAINDSRQAIGRNEDIFLAVVLLSVMLGYAFSDSAASLLLFCFQAMSAGSDATGLSIGLLTLMSIGVLATAFLWVVAFVLGGLSLAQMDGANGKRQINLRATLRRSLASTSRVSTSWLLLGIISGIILAIIGAPIAIYYYLHYLHTGPSSAFYGLSALWSLAGLFGLASFSLIPQVALFEANLPLLRAPMRSYQLLSHRGRPFVLALQATLAASIGLSFGLSKILQGIIGNGSSVLFYVLTTVLLISSQLVLTALYRKRKLARR